MAQMGRDRTHRNNGAATPYNPGFRTQVADSQFGLEQTGTEACGSVTVMADDESVDDGDDTDDTVDDGDDDTDPTGPPDDPEEPRRVPDDVPFIGGKEYTDPTVVGTGAALGLVGIAALNN